MNTVVQEKPHVQILSANPPEQAIAPIILTAQTLLRGRRDIRSSLRTARFDLRYVAAWKRLPEAIDRIQTDIVLVDMDAADVKYEGATNISGRRLVTVLAHQLATRPIALVVMTRLDFAEIEDLVHAGIHALVSPMMSACSLIEHLRVALDSAQRRYDLSSARRASKDPAPNCPEWREDWFHRM